MDWSENEFRLKDRHGAFCRYHDCVMRELSGTCSFHVVNMIKELLIVLLDTKLAED